METTAVNLHQTIRSRLRDMLRRDDDDEVVLNEALRLLAKYRSTLIRNTLVKQQGTRVLGGPFRGMEFLAHSAEGCHVPKLLGCYEEELHDFILALPKAGYETVVNLGCAEGYYAVGIKRLLPGASVYAFDIDLKARKLCEALAAKNGVVISVGGEFRVQDFERFAQAGGRTLVWCDIEGGEIDLLNPAKAPSLACMDIVAELHPTASGHAIEVLPSRFAGSHDVEILQTRGHAPTLPDFLQRLGHLDQLLAQWEWRAFPTPWLVLRARRAVLTQS